MPTDTRNDRQEPRERPYWIEITGQAAGTNRYAWSQINDTQSSSFSTNLPTGFKMSGTTTSWSAYEIEGREDVPVGTKVLAHISAAGSFWIFRYDGPGSRAGWMSSLTTDSCLKLSVVSASGICSGIDTTQIRIFHWDAGVAGWVSDTDFAVETGTSPVTFWLDGGRARLQLDSFSYELFLEEVGDGYAVYSGDSTLLCNGTTAGECADNSFRVRVECHCCPPAGYTGPGWYCVKVSGTDCATGTLICVDYTTTVPCSTVVLCSGPHASQAACEAACTGAGSGGDSTFCSRTLAATLTATIFGGQGTLTMNWNAGAGRYEGNKILPCGEQLYLRFNPALDHTTSAVTYSCDGVTFRVSGFGVAQCGPPYEYNAKGLSMVDPNAGCPELGGSCLDLDIDIAE